MWAKPSGTRDCSKYKELKKGHVAEVKKVGQRMVWDEAREVIGLSHAGNYLPGSGVFTAEGLEKQVMVGYGRYHQICTLKIFVSIWRTNYKGPA